MRACDTQCAPVAVCERAAQRMLLEIAKSFAISKLVRIQRLGPSFLVLSERLVGELAERLCGARESAIPVVLGRNLRENRDGERLLLLFRELCCGFKGLFEEIGHRSHQER